MSEKNKQKYNYASCLRCSRFDWDEWNERVAWFLSGAYDKPETTIQTCAEVLAIAKFYTRKCPDVDTLREHLAGAARVQLNKLELSK